MSDDASRSAAAARLAVLRAGFAKRLIERLDELADALARAHTGDAEARAHARMLAHRLAGTAGAYGHDAAGRHAASIEALLLGDAPLAAATWNEIDGLLDAARRG